MPTTSIPNLLSLGSSRGGGPGTSRGRGGRGSQVSSTTSSHDATIQGTDTDASVSRLSAVHLGYLDDPFAQYFVQTHKLAAPPIRRLPIINRGTDTRCFRLLSGGNLRNLVYHEVDFPAVSARKFQTVQAVPTLRSILTNAEADGDSWSSRHLPNGCQYWCHGLDLRDLAKAEATGLKGVLTDVHTLLISECCLCYLEPAEADGVIKHFAASFASLGIVIYEPIKPDDLFGRQMVSNLAARQISMPTVHVYRSTTDQQVRLREVGFSASRTLTVEDVWKSWVSPEEKDRVDELEGLDEVEEWKLLAGHYVVAWAWRGESLDGLQNQA